jgi:outer membrane lipoprotein-sorting protein
MSGSFFLWDDPAEAGVPETLDETIVRVSAEQPGRYREESGAGEDLELVVRDGPRWWSYDSFLGPQSNEHETQPSASTVTGRCEGLLAPAPLMGLLHFEPAGSAERAGRRVLRVAARPRERLDLPGLSLARGADDYELEVDAERGVLLRVNARFGGQELSVIEAREVAFDEALAPDAFVFTAPAR